MPQRIGFVIGDGGFAAVLYRESLSDARTRTPWTPDADLVVAWGVAWGERLRVPVDVVRIDTRLLQTVPE